ncbi:hypothetical protein F5X99DRAFT_409027 [Biscogniauxia marginata]|nr:hypothetical protein F5X99DRAFT_409027 [Biscogniauxia marginata]
MAIIHLWIFINVPAISGLAYISTLKMTLSRQGDYTWEAGSGYVGSQLEAQTLGRLSVTVRAGQGLDIKQWSQ